jgi:hypothetical protein
VLPWHSQQHSTKKAFFFAVLGVEGRKEIGQTEEVGAAPGLGLQQYAQRGSGEKMNIKRTFRRVSCLLTRLLANMGAAGQTPLLSRFAGPVGEDEKRWLDGFYLDVPEEWDDPYRFFRW